MRKNKHFFKRKPFSLKKESEALLCGGVLLLLAPLLRLLYEIRLAAPFSPATAARFGGYLEYIVAALTLLLLGVLLLEKVAAQEEKRK